MKFICQCGWEGDEGELRIFDDGFFHRDTGQLLSDLSWCECPECGAEPEQDSGNVGANYLVDK